MISLSVNVYRGCVIESKHKAICLIKDISNKEIFSTKNNNSIVYPRSAIKIFQALPFVVSNAHVLFNLTKENIAISCSSHAGENQHLNILNKWIKKINIKIKQLKCGIHNPLDEKSSNNLLLSGEKPTQLHNNCSGKHLGIISGCLAQKMEINNYNNYNHPYQKLIRDSLENFMQTKINKKNIGTDGCNLPQYAFKISNIATSMINLIKEQERKNKYSEAINIILPAIKKFPLLIGGHNRFDSEIIQTTKGRIFCKGGAEGVFLFADFYKKIGGAIKIEDGNNRAIPSIVMKLFCKFNMLNDYENNKLKKWSTQKLYNHDNKEIGKITFDFT